MSIFLLWHRPEAATGQLEPQHVAAKLQQIFAPLFGAPLEQKVWQNASTALVILHQPVRGWKAPFFQEDEQTWAFANDYPLNGRSVLAGRGTAFAADHFLPALCRKLEEDPRSLLKDLSPPVSLIWSAKERAETYVQNDGLGHAQLFEFQSGPRWALSNKVFAFKALGWPLQPIPEQWAIWATLDWFPVDMTGYANIRFVAPSTQIRLQADRISRTQHDVLSEWVHPPGLSPGDCLELARSSLLAQVNACQPFWETPSVGLSGGWDSRAVVSTLRVAGAAFSARVRGLPGRHDVVLATELARIAGFPIRVKSSRGYPPDDPDACQRSIQQALLWQGGHMTGHKHKTFLAREPHLKQGTVGLTGQHGEIGRRDRVFYGDYRSRTVPQGELAERQYEEDIVALMTFAPPFTRPALREQVRESILQAYHQADRYELKGLARVDFFCLFEDGRRWGSAAHAAQTGLLVAPFLNADYIRAVFGFRDRADTNAFHRHIISTNAPDWSAVPFSDELDARELAGAGVGSVDELEKSTDASAGWKQPKGSHNYNRARYWQAVGKPLIDQALANGGFWTEVFDPDAAREQWADNPDALAILCQLPGALQS